MSDDCTRCATLLEEGDLRCAVCALPVAIVAERGVKARARILRCTECGAAIGYDAQIRPFTTQFIPLDEAWSEVLGFVSRLEIPDR